MDRCPYCNHEGKFYIETQITGTGSTYYRFDKTEVDYSHIHDSLNYKDGEWAHCANCHKKIFKTEDYTF